MALHASIKPLNSHHCSEIDFRTCCQKDVLTQASETEYTPLRTSEEQWSRCCFAILHLPFCKAENAVIAGISSNLVFGVSCPKL